MTIRHNDWINTEQSVRLFRTESLSYVIRRLRIGPINDNFSIHYEVTTNIRHAYGLKFRMSRVPVDFFGLDCKLRVIDPILKQARRDLDK